MKTFHFTLKVTGLKIFEILDFPHFKNYAYFKTEKRFFGVVFCDKYLSVLGIIRRAKTSKNKRRLKKTKFQDFGAFALKNF